MNDQARRQILASIRNNLAVSAPFDRMYSESNSHVQGGPAALSTISEFAEATESLVDLFRENLEIVDGHCVVVPDEARARGALREIISSLGETDSGLRRIVLSDVPIVNRLADILADNVEYVSAVDDVGKLFTCDVGITSAQLAIAETGTLVLDASKEQHRLASLLPPVHIAIISSSQICLTLGEALAAIHANGSEISSTVTFITGPSRTADIELTLAIGVHGPQKLYVLVITGT